jgi:hypothetical protein
MLGISGVDQDYTYFVYASKLQRYTSDRGEDPVRLSKHSVFHRWLWRSKDFHDF